MNPDSFYGSVCFKGQVKVSLKWSGMQLLENLSFPLLLARLLGQLLGVQCRGISVIGFTV